MFPFSILRTSTLKFSLIIIFFITISGCKKAFKLYQIPYDYITTIHVLDDEAKPLQNQEVRLYINIYGEIALQDTVSRIIPNSPFKTTPIPVIQIQKTDKNGTVKFKYRLWHLESQFEHAMLLVRDDERYFSKNMFIHTVPVKIFTLRTIKQDTTIHRHKKY